MSEKHVEIEMVCTFAGQSMNANGTSTVSFGAAYDELANVMQLCQLMSNDITVTVTVPGSDPAEAARYIRLQEIKISGDGASTVRLKGSTSFVDTELVSSLPNRQSDIQQFRVKFTSMIELEDEPVDTDDWDDDDYDDDTDWEE